MEMDFSLDLIIYALDKATENELWEYWKLNVLKDKENFISFEDYKAKFVKKDYKSSDVSYEEIEEEMAKVEKAFQERR